MILVPGTLTTVQSVTVGVLRVEGRSRYTPQLARQLMGEMVRALLGGSVALEFEARTVRGILISIFLCLVRIILIPGTLTTVTVR